MLRIEPESAGWEAQTPPLLPFRDEICIGDCHWPPSHWWLRRINSILCFFCMELLSENKIIWNLSMFWWPEKQSLKTFVMLLCGTIPFKLKQLISVGIFYLVRNFFVKFLIFDSLDLWCLKNKSNEILWGRFIAWQWKTKCEVFYSNTSHYSQVLQWVNTKLSLKPQFKNDSCKRMTCKKVFFPNYDCKRLTEIESIFFTILTENKIKGLGYLEPGDWLGQLCFEIYLCRVFFSI